MIEGAELSPGYVGPIAELVDDIYAIACDLRVKLAHAQALVTSHEKLLLKIYSHEFGASTQQMKVAIAQALNGQL